MLRSRQRGTTWLLALVVFALLPLPAIAQDTEEDAARDYETQRQLAEKEAADPDVVTYRARIARDLDTILEKAFLHCARRELYSRRAWRPMVLTIADDGSIDRVTVKTVNRMGECAENTLPGNELPAPPKGPIRLAVGGEPEPR